VLVKPTSTTGPSTPAAARSQSSRRLAIL